jgi:hypothetical protein
MTGAVVAPDERRHDGTGVSVGRHLHGQSSIRDHHHISSTPHGHGLHLVFFLLRAVDAEASASDSTIAHNSSANPTSGRDHLCTTIAAS